MTLSNEFISRDEALHTEFAVLLYNKLRNRLTEGMIHHIIKDAVEIEKEPDCSLADFYGAVRTAWQQEAETNEMFRNLVQAAQNCDYSTLKAEFGRKF